jgi:hypothetical protein
LGFSILDIFKNVHFHFSIKKFPKTQNSFFQNFHILKYFKHHTDYRNKMCRFILLAPKSFFQKVAVRLLKNGHFQKCPKKCPKNVQFKVFQSQHDSLRVFNKPISNPQKCPKLYRLVVDFEKNVHFFYYDNQSHYLTFTT